MNVNEDEECKYFSAVSQLKFMIEMIHVKPKFVPGFEYWHNDELEILGLYREEVKLTNTFTIKGYKVCDLERVYLKLKTDEVSTNQPQQMRRI